MPNNVNTNGSIDPVLTGLLYEVVQDRADYVGGRVAPMRKIDGLSGQYTKREGKSQLNLDQTDEGLNRILPVSLQAPSRPAGISFTTGSVALDRYADHVFVNEAVRNHWRASGDFDVMRPAMDELVTIIHDRHEWTTLTGIYGDDTLYGYTSDPGNLNTTTTSILKPLQTCRRAVRKGVRRDPNIAIVNEEVRDALLLNDDVRARSGAGNLADQSARPEQLESWFREYLGVELVVVKGYYEAADGTDTPFFPNHIALAYVADDSSPSFVNTFVNDYGVDLETLAGVYEEDIKDPRGTKVIGDVYYKIQRENAAAGALLTDVLS